VNDALKRVPFKRLYEHMHMVGHDYPRMEAIALPIEVQESVFNKSSDFKIFQKTGSVACIKVSLYPFTFLRIVHQVYDAFPFLTP